MEYFQECSTSTLMFMHLSRLQTMITHWTEWRFPNLRSGRGKSPIEKLLCFKPGIEPRIPKSNFFGSSFEVDQIGNNVIPTKNGIRCETQYSSGYLLANLVTQFPPSWLDEHGSFIIIQTMFCLIYQLIYHSVVKLWTLSTIFQELWNQIHWFN